MILKMNGKKQAQLVESMIISYGIKFNKSADRLFNAKKEVIRCRASDLQKSYLAKLKKMKYQQLMKHLMKCRTYQIYQKQKNIHY